MNAEIDPPPGASDRSRPDLSTFARSQTVVSRPRRIWTRVLMAALVLGFVGLLVERSYDAWLPKREVTIVRPQPLADSGTRWRSGTVVAEAAGFVEAEPEPIFVTPRVDGIYAEVLHRSGDSVEVGALLARIDETDLRALLEEAEFEHAAANSVAAAMTMEHELAVKDHDEAPDLVAAAAAAEAQSNAAQEEAKHRLAAVSGAEAQRDVARLELEREQLLLEQGVAGPKQFEIARARLVTAEAELEAKRADAAKAAADAAAAKSESTRAAIAVERKTGLATRRAAAIAARTRAEADAAIAAIRLVSAQRAVDRCLLVAPAKGVIARANAIPGSKAIQDEAAFVLFDPEKLRCRVDMPLARVSALSIGQSAKITPEGSTRALRGEIVRFAGEADLARVALRVHVRFLEFAPELVPERVCRVEFLGIDPKDGVDRSTRDDSVGVGGGEPETAGGSVVSIPKEALREGDIVMILDPSGTRARRRVVTRAGETDDSGTITITSGLDPSHKVILDRDVEDGDSVTPKERGGPR